MTALSLLTRGYISAMKRTVASVPISATQGQALLESVLEVPNNELGTESLGIHQSDIIIRTALLAAIKDMRSDPRLLDFVFRSLAFDNQTVKDYGEKSISKAKEWFLKTDIPVSMVPRIDEGKWPRITISLADSQETENTLGDIHYQSMELLSANWPPLTKTFTPAGYDPQTGKIVLANASSVPLGPGMSIVDKVGKPHTILSVDSNAVFYIEPNTIVDLRDSVIKGVRPTSSIALESSVFKETYHIGVHVGSEPVHLTWLHSIVTFAILRYRQAFLEARGFERSTVSSSDFSRNEQFEAELIFSRYLTLTGYVRQYWPKIMTKTINTVTPELRINPADKMPVGPNDVNKDNSLWIGHNDIFDKDGIG